MAPQPGMDAIASSFNDEQGPSRDDLRQKVATALLDQLDRVTSDMVAIFPYSGTETLSQEDCRKVGTLLVQLLAYATRDGRIDARAGFLADLHHVMLQRSVSVERLFTFAYLVERAALDELAVDEALGATSEAWPLAAQLIRRASFDVLAGYAGRVQLEPNGASTTDRLTTLLTRAVFELMLAKEVERAGHSDSGISSGSTTGWRDTSRIRWRSCSPVRTRRTQTTSRNVCGRPSRNGSSSWTTEATAPSA